MQSRIQSLMLTLLALFLAACGSGISGGNGFDALSSSNGCITASCHGSLVSKVTGRAIASEWKASVHFSADVAGCRTCHGHSHQNSCQNCTFSFTESLMLIVPFSWPPAWCSGCPLISRKIHTGYDSVELELFPPVLVLGERRLILLVQKIGP